jgi:hypothetical protein
MARFGVNRLIAFGLAAGVVPLRPGPHGRAVAGPAHQLLHGPSFAVLWAAGWPTLTRPRPPGWGATAQGLFSAAVSGSARPWAAIGGPAAEIIGFARLFGFSAG